jgi:hypothetical protein
MGSILAQVVGVIEQHKRVSDLFSCSRLDPSLGVPLRKNQAVPRRCHKLQAASLVVDTGHTRRAGRASSNAYMMDTLG